MTVHSPLPQRGPDQPREEHARGIPAGFEVTGDLMGQADTSTSAAASQMTEPVGDPKRFRVPKAHRRAESKG